MILCCVCGGPFEEDDKILRMTAYRFSSRIGNPNYQLLRGKFDDDTTERFAHYICPIEAGGPMSLIGADGERFDV